MSEQYKVIEKIEKRSVVVGRVCDICGRPIPPSFGTWELKPYYRITTGHYDWGNDSCDSVETLDVCSPACAIEFVSEYLNERYDSRNSSYLNIEHINFWFIPDNAKNEVEE